MLDDENPTAPCCANLLLAASKYCMGNGFLSDVYRCKRHAFFCLRIIDTTFRQIWSMLTSDLLDTIEPLKNASSLANSFTCCVKESYALNFGLRPVSSQLVQSNGFFFFHIVFIIIVITNTHPSAKDSTHRIAVFFISGDGNCVTSSE
jgi:hypothetical protein